MFASVRKERNSPKLAPQSPRWGLKSAGVRIPKSAVVGYSQALLGSTARMYVYHLARFTEIVHARCR